MGVEKVVIKKDECKIVFGHIDDVKDYVDDIKLVSNVVLEVETMPIIVVKANMGENILDKAQNFLELCTT